MNTENVATEAAEDEATAAEEVAEASRGCASDQRSEQTRWQE